VLNGNSGKKTGTVVRMTIRDQSGRIVFQLQTTDGAAAASGDVVLVAGSYNVQIMEIPPQGTSAPDLQFALFMAKVSDPVGAASSDTTTTPSGGSSSGSDSTGSSSTQSTWTSQSPSNGSYWF
jgi:hypothetical protein